MKINSFGQVSKITLGDKLEGLFIEHKNCQASISLYGGQVLTWQPKNHRPVFWLSQSSSYQQGKAIRGGIPLCWPWFGLHHADIKAEAGNHGFARQQNWRLDSVELNELGVIVILSWQGRNTHPLWPTHCKLEQTLFFGLTFSQVLTMTNLSDEDVEYTGALHSYFSVSAPKNITVTELSALKFDDKLTSQKGIIEPLLSGLGPVDRVYWSNSNDKQVMHIVDKAWQRTVEIEAENASQWVFWNPGREVAQKMLDIHKDGEQEYICLEVANTQPQKITAKNTVTIGQTIRVIRHE